MATTAQWVRFALTGDPDSTEPASGTITMLEAGAKQELINQWPSCLEGAPEALAEEADQDAFTEALGYLIASKIVMTPGGAQFAQYVVSTKIGPVTKTRQSPALTATQAQSELLKASSAALSRIACVREALASSPKPSFVTLAGRRRALGCCR